MKKSNEFVECIDDEGLKIIGKEIIEWHDTSILCDGLLSILAKELENEYDLEYSEVLCMAESLVLREICKRFIKE
jgi:hypothetical protein